MLAQKEAKKYEKGESVLLETVEELGINETNTYILYGEPQVGKTRFAIRLAELYSEMGYIPKFIVTEVNWGMKYGGKSMFDTVKQKFGSEAIYVPKNIENILTLQLPNKPFLVFDSLGSIVYDIVTHAMQFGRHPLSITPYAIQLSNSIVYKLAAQIAALSGIGIFITHSTTEIMKKYRGAVEKKPAFSSRALHAVTGIYFMYIDNDSRKKIKIVSHRFDKSLEGKEIDITDLLS
jgi:hypothetical protein